jgi:hypothetical protein
MGISKGKAIGWCLLAVSLLVSFPSRPAAHTPECQPYSTCVGCQECATYKYSHCRSDAAAKYSECVFDGTPESVCEYIRQSDLATCQSNFDYVWAAACWPFCGAPGDDRINPVPSDQPVDFGRKGTNTLSATCGPGEDTKGAEQKGPVPVEVAQATLTHRMLMIIGRFGGAHQVPCSQQQGQIVLLSGPESVGQFYHYQSYEQFELQGLVVGPYMLSGPGTTCDPAAWKAEALAFAAQDKDVINAGGISSFDSTTYVFPQIGGTACQGSRSDGQKVIEVYGACYEDPIAHELGHILGLGDSLASPAPPGTVYGDRSTTMGDEVGIDVLRDFAAPHKIQLGWIPDGPAPAEDRVLEVADTGLYTVSMLESVVAGTNQVLQLPAVTPGQPDAYYVSFRSGIGGFGENVPADYQPKMNVHHWAGGTAATWFLGSNEDNSQAFADGQTWAAEGNKWCATMVSRTGTLAYVWVSPGCEKEPPAACPVVSPCPGLRCVRAAELFKDDTGLHECVTAQGTMLECQAPQVLQVVHTNCNKAPCCTNRPPTCNNCPTSCGGGTYLECR